MIEGRTAIKRAFLSGTTRRVQLQIFDTGTSVGFQPDTLTLSVYDVDPVTGLSVMFPTIYRCWPWASTTVPIVLVTSVIVNGRNDADISAFVDAAGNVDFYLDPADTSIDVQPALVAQPHQRVLLFTWTWDAPVKTGKHEIVLSIVPDRETVAS